MQVEWYRSFTEAAKWRSLSKAADQLNLTQPAISKQIRNLEAAFGVELFRRGTAGVDLTEAGRHFLERIGPIVDTIDALRAEMRSFAEDAGLSLGCLPSVATHVLPGRLRDYYASGFPIRVHVRSSSEELLEGLQRGSFDAVLIDGAYLRANSWSRPLFTESYIAILPEGHPLQGRQSLDAGELRGESFVFAQHCDSHAGFSAIAKRYGYEPEVKLEVDHNDYLFGVVAVGTGITVMPELFRIQAERLGLHAVPVRDADLRRTIVLVARNADTGSRLYRLLNGATESAAAR